MGTWTDKNDVEWLIDAVATYRKMIALLDWVGTAHGQGYVHISMWECNPYTDLDGAGTLLWQKIKTLADAGNEIRFLLWKPGTLENLWGPDFVSTTKLNNETCKQVIEANNPPPAAVVTLAEHRDVEGAYHEKTMIFCNGDEVRVIVGGLNIANICRDAAPHAPRPAFATAFSGYPNWHDVAVFLRGPVTNDVEEDFEQRWNLDPPSPVVPVKRRDMSAFAPGTQIASAMQSLHPSLTVYTRDIFRSLTESIAAGIDYLYFENYSIHDWAMLKEIVRWIRAQKAQHQPHDVIMVIPFPTDPKYPYDWIHYFTYCVIGFEQCDVLRYDDNGTNKFVARGPKWRFHKRGKWHWDSTVEWSGGRTSIRNLRGFYTAQQPTTPGGAVALTEITPMYTPVYFAGPMAPTTVYIHSKVFFTKNTAAVGSANFNPRSLEGEWHLFTPNDPLDGELTAFIQGDTVEDLRVSLWTEWFGAAPAPSAWQGKAQANHTLVINGGAAAGRIYMLPLYHAAFAAQYPATAAKKLLSDEPNNWGGIPEY